MIGTDYRAVAVAAAMTCSLIGCGDTAPSGSGGSGGTRGPDGPQTLGFVFSQLGFHLPEGRFAPANRNVSVDGFDLDGRASTADNSQADECAHDDYTGPNGETGIDYRMLDLMDQIETFQPNNTIDSIAQAAITNGEMTGLMEVSGVNDMQNDDDVQVQVFSSMDFPAVGAASGVIPGGTLAAHPDDSLNSDVVSGRIEDGVLIVGPIDIVLDFNIQVVDLQLTINRSWIRVRLAADGQSGVGVFAGFWSVDEIITTIAVPTNWGAAIGSTREEFEAGLALADGDYNGEICESISMMFDFEVVQAFIVK